jgi:hypothetical protein
MHGPQPSSRLQRGSHPSPLSTTHRQLNSGFNTATATRCISLISGAEASEGNFPWCYMGERKRFQPAQ